MFGRKKQLDVRQSNRELISALQKTIDPAFDASITDVDTQKKILMVGLTILLSDREHESFNRGYQLGILRGQVKS